MYYDQARTPSPLATNNTWQIPSAVISHSFILLMIGRYGRYGTHLLNVNEIRNSAFDTSDGALSFPEGSLSSYWRVSINPSGVLKLVSMYNTNNAPNVIAFGIL